MRARKDIGGHLLLLMWLLAASSAFGQGTSFTYQGKLTDGSSPANGTYDFQFKLFDTATLGTGTQFGTAQTLTNVSVSGGIFAVQLDFGACPACFNGGARFLEIAVRPTGGGSFTTLGPRQPFTLAPYALRSQSAAAADGLSVACVNCVTSSQIGSVNGSAVTGTIPVGSVPAGSGSYIQNTTTQQGASNGNISGDGTLGGTLSANAVDATTQFNLGGSREAGIANLRIHDLRHTFGTRAADADVPLRAVQDVMGHSSIAMTERRAHATDEGKRRVVEAAGLSRSVVVKMASKKAVGEGDAKIGGLEIVGTSQGY